MSVRNLIKSSTTNTPATWNQLKALRRLGYVPKGRISYQEAVKVMDTLMDRVRHGLCTLKQARILEENGFDPEHVTFEQAKKYIADILGKGSDGVPEEVLY